MIVAYFRLTAKGLGGNGYPKKGARRAELTRALFMEMSLWKIALGDARASKDAPINTATSEGRLGEVEAMKAGYFCPKETFRLCRRNGTIFKIWKLPKKKAL